MKGSWVAQTKVMPDNKPFPESVRWRGEPWHLVHDVGHTKCGLTIPTLERVFSRLPHLGDCQACEKRYIYP